MPVTLSGSEPPSDTRTLRPTSGIARFQPRHFPNSRRNKVKRVLREAFWALSDRLPPRHDFVIVARGEINDLIEKNGMEGVKENLEEALAKVRST